MEGTKSASPFATFFPFLRLPTPYARTILSLGRMQNMHPFWIWLWQHGHVIVGQGQVYEKTKAKEEKLFRSLIKWHYKTIGKKAYVNLERSESIHRFHSSTTTDHQYQRPRSPHKPNTKHPSVWPFGGSFESLKTFFIKSTGTHQFWPNQPWKPDV